MPAGVSSVHVVAVGGMGGGGDPGRRGATVTGDLKVTSGETLYAVVGTSGGGQRLGPFGGAGGANGGGPGAAGAVQVFSIGNFNGVGGAGGGGASDVRTSLSDPKSRLIVAAGGGGDAGQSIPSGGGRTTAVGGNGGDSGGHAGGNGEGTTSLLPGNSAGLGGGGGAGTSGGSGGSGGAASAFDSRSNFGPGTNGSSGALAAGGGGGVAGVGSEVSAGFFVALSNGGGGGGGGGGLYGGGGGGGGGGVGGGGGGGGGSNLVPAGVSQSLDATGTPIVQISYTVAKQGTSTSVSCSPTRLAPGDATVCTATVRTSPGGVVSTPAGTVRFTSSGAGRFGGSPCTLTGTGDAASCAVFFTSFARGGQVMTAAYGGDATHQASTARTLVGVALPASTNGCVVFARGRITAADGDRARFLGLSVAGRPRGIELIAIAGPRTRSGSCPGASRR